MKCNFVKDLKNADSEKLIEAIYHTELKRQINNAGGQVIGIQTGNKTDGILTAEFLFNGKPKVLNLIIETKYAETFSSTLVRAKVLAQVIYYLKSIYSLGNELPNIVFVGDSDECFVLHTNLLQEYLQNNYDWTIAPSKAGIRNIALVDSLCSNNGIQKECFVFTIDDNFLMRDVVDRIVNLVNSVKLKVRITERSISRVFDHFSMRVLKKNANGSSKCSSRDQVEFFMTLVLNTDDCFRHPKKRDTAIFKSKEVSVYSDAFDALLGYYAFDYNAEDKKSFTSICDRLLEDSERRRNGDFYTPTIWVDEAHKMLSQNLGSEWKNDYIIWDCACGTLNLTRDYKFFDLYCSTLSESDLKISNKYNQEAESKFQYDFLNDDVVLFDQLLEKVKKGYKLFKKDFFSSILWYKAPNLINGMLSGKKLLFFINPPYGTSGEMSSAGTGKVKKDGIAASETNILMQRNNIGACSQQLYAQFLYRIHALEILFNLDYNVGLFSPSLIMTGIQFSWFRKQGLRDKFIDGFFFQASQFADVKNNWCISFTLWGNVGSNLYRLKAKDYSMSSIVTIRSKDLYSLDKDLKASSWAKSKSGLYKEQYKTFTMSNALTVTDGECGYADNLLGYGVMDTNIVEKNTQFVMLLNRKLKGHLSSYPIIKSNFSDIMSYYSARRLITGQYATWLNCKDEYRIPNITHVLYNQWNNDCIVYSLFNVATNLSSLRDIDYDSTKCDILNSFFFMSINEITQLALGTSPNDTVYTDIQNNAKEERFVYTKLNVTTLSADATLVLNKARELTVASFKYRKYFAQEHPEYHINTWDAGWYQIKGLLKAYMPEGLKEFNNLYKQLENRMRPLVYELGFLYK